MEHLRNVQVNHDPNGSFFDAIVSIDGGWRQYRKRGYTASLLIDIQRIELY